jgi:hypothetical protein
MISPGRIVFVIVGSVSCMCGIFTVLYALLLRKSVSVDFVLLACFGVSQITSGIIDLMRPFIMDDSASWTYGHRWCYVWLHLSNTAPHLTSCLALLSCVINFCKCVFASTPITLRITRYSGKLTLSILMIVNAVVFPGLLEHQINMDYKISGTVCSWGYQEILASPLISTVVCQWIPCCLTAILSTALCAYRHYLNGLKGFLIQAKFWIVTTLSIIHAVALLLTCTVIFISYLRNDSSNPTTQGIITAYHIISLVNLIAIGLEFLFPTE